jgi:hypothetical protein
MDQEQDDRRPSDSDQPTKKQRPNIEPLATTVEYEQQAGRKRRRSKKLRRKTRRTRKSRKSRRYRR